VENQFTANVLRQGRFGCPETAICMEFPGLLDLFAACSDIKVERGRLRLARPMFDLLGALCPTAIFRTKK